jgi:hypothetical protein
MDINSEVAAEFRCRRQGGLLVQLPSNVPNRPPEREDLARDWAEHPFNAAKTYGKSSRVRWSAVTQ